MKHQVNDQLTNFRSDILNGLDAVMGELKTIREEQTTMHHQEHEDVNDKIDVIATKLNLSF